MFTRSSFKEQLSTRELPEEVSGSTGKKELMSIYKVAAEDEFSFLYANLSARKGNEMFFNNFTGRIEVEDVSNH